MTESEQKVAEKLGFYLMAPKNIPSFWIRNGGNCDITLNDGQRRSLWDALVAAQSQHAERWIAVTPDTMPTIGQLCLIVWGGNVQHCAYMWTGKVFALPESLDGCIGGDDMPTDEVSAWQPLPAAPERSK